MDQPSAFYPNSDTINPVALMPQSTVDVDELFDFGPDFNNAYCTEPGNPAALSDLAPVDSAVDLTSFATNPLDEIENFFADPNSNIPSPAADDIIFSNANSPGDFMRNMDFEAPAIHIPHPPADLPTPKVHIHSDKNKTRAETQIKVNLILDAPAEGADFIHFERKTLAKPKLLASAEECETMESSGAAVHMDMMLVCATAIEQPDREQQAWRRARGEEPRPRRPQGTSISELDKDDPAHPQNGGEVIICDGCKERERKRYDRKKKRAEDEEEWSRYEDERIIMINEKEYKKWKDVEPGDHQFSPKAKQVEFAMRIACYCRHQEEKSPVGYKVIFTFKDTHGNVLVQHTSDIFQITDDHKNKEVAPPEAIPRPMPITIPHHQYVVHQHVPAPVYYNQYPPNIMPPAPVMTNMANYSAPLDMTNYSAPGSVPHTPIHLSRPASPTWEDGPAQKRQNVRYLYFYLGDG